MTATAREPGPRWVHDRFFIGGQWVSPSSDAVIEVRSPATEEVVTRFPAATEADAGLALRAARRAFDEGPWPRMSPQERADVVMRIAAEFAKRKDLMAEAYVAEAGATVTASKAMHDRAATYWTRAADLVTYFPFEELRGWPGGDGRARVILAPAGVAVGIQPFNAPVLSAGQKAAPALVAGCTMVLKSAVEDPTAMMVLSEALAAVPELPPGVLNIIPGGADVGRHLVSSPLVDKVSFTGSTAAGAAIMAACAPNITRLTLELGGKSAAIVTDDVDLDAVIEPLLWGAMRSCGQVCYATTRVLVQRASYDRVADALAGAMRSLRIGDPRDPETQLGPLVSRAHRERVKAMVGAAVSEGVRLVCGGGIPAHLERGWYFEPTLFAAEDNSVSIARQEVFGPVITVIPYDTQADAIAIANDSSFGLGGAVFCRDVERAVAIARSIRTGHVYINSTGAYTGQPFGGFKRSGFGREGGPEGLLEWLEPQVIFS